MANYQQIIASVKTHIDVRTCRRCGNCCHSEMPAKTHEDPPAFDPDQKLVCHVAGVIKLPVATTDICDHWRPSSD